MNYLDNFKLWKTSSFFDEKTRDELSGLDEKNDKKEIEDRFYKDLEFGTAGLRGIMGAGTNRMNKYTVGKATAGFVKYLKKAYSHEDCISRGVVVAFDTRNNSEFFAGVTADIFSANDIKVNFLKVTSPIPVMSYAIRDLGAIGGVVITASHNPREYNGYKAYDETGCQLTPKVAEEVISYVNSVSKYEEINFSRNDALVNSIDYTDKFISEILKQSRVNDLAVKSNLKVVYTPIHGSGYIPVSKVLKKDGFADVFVVEEQALPNGNFPTVSAPNPETKDALNMGIEKAQEIGADIVLGTDPDADRVGVAARVDGTYKLFTGNQIGAILVDFIIKKLNRKKALKPIIIKSIVTSELGAQIARKNNVLMVSVLTGFKFIGDMMTRFEKAKKIGDEKLNYDFLMGYEESYGYLIGSHARDKDAVVSSMLICECAAELKAEGKTLDDKLKEIYQAYGCFVDSQDNITMPGKDGLEKISNIMKSLRSDGLKLDDLKEVVDYNKGVLIDDVFGSLPKSNVIKYVLNDDSWIAVRPSGTEPKIKIYYSMKGENEQSAAERISKYQAVIKKSLGL